MVPIFPGCSYVYIFGLRGRAKWDLGAEFASLYNQKKNGQAQNLVFRDIDAICDPQEFHELVRVNEWQLLPNTLARIDRVHQGHFDICKFLRLKLAG